jgi:hypothetical protein
MLRKALEGEGVPKDQQKKFTKRKTISKYWIDPDEGIRKKLFKLCKKRNKRFYEEN